MHLIHFCLKFCLEPDCSKPSFKKVFPCWNVWVLVGDSSHTVQFQFSIPSSSVFLLARNCIQPAGSADVLAWVKLSGTCLRLSLSVVRLLTASEIDSKLSIPCTPSWGLIRYIQRLDEYKSGTQNVPLKGMSCGNSTCVGIRTGVSGHSLPR